MRSRSSSSSKGKHSAIRNRLTKPEQVKEVKVVMFCEKARNPFAGKRLPTFGSLSEVNLNDEKREIWQRRSSRL